MSSNQVPALDLAALELWSVMVLEDSHDPAERDNATNFLALIQRVRQLERVVERLRQIADITPGELAALAAKQ